MRAADNTRGIEMNRMKESSSALQRLAKGLKQRHDFMKQLYDSRNTTIVDGVKKINEGYEFLRKRVNTLWNERCKPQEVMKKKDDDLKIKGTPIPLLHQNNHLQLPSLKSLSTNLHRLNLRKAPPVEQLKKYNKLNLCLVLLALNAMKDVDDAEIEKMPIEPETENAENIEEIVFEGESNKSTYVRADGTEFDPFNEEWMKENQEEIDEKLKNRASSDNPTDSFEEWRKRFLSRDEEPTPPEAQVDFL
ncbi:hypothetical protein HanXRQr2_Chr13g0606251 [Helianthus annuus]|uniref:Uncharacterized protein n=1 Tax=Helianthus annuus TaxID=4232 RepID=A0A9K3EN12_HELAN|nr:hypothetical protein HanXRQr2_Chr13g0606251 [Helianthus annuus]KAJ0499044.1 hypothetical protein HanHA89_Chr13g0529831 [Helianthus annuus]KAJ0665058.1 hypothetical protein HanLR1_Chr13g0499861 [Helianthus annuus]KAJ0672478.1 hypothetical protein HanOQP8_Chr13g0497831 [Helianthus annuus]KAJ0850749.1 hypothetical protein HanPSC8_Chr13g0584501 [Helianthus annuus]